VLIAGKRVAVEPLAAWLDRDSVTYDVDLCRLELGTITDGYFRARFAAPLAFARSILEQP